jgi:hypothetical protein
VPVPLSILFVQQLVASASAAIMVMLLFASIGPSVSWTSVLRTRPWHSWLWRLIASASSYLLFYFIFGALNYSLITKPYYDTHAGGLTAPAPEIVFMIEPIRGVFIIFLVLLFLLSFRGTKRQTVIMIGWLLFAIVGIVPLVLQVRMLPLFLLAASAVEIFLQNFLTGAVVAWLMSIEDPVETPAKERVKQPVPS